MTKLNQAEERLRERASLLDLAQTAILVRDPSNRITFWNRGAERLYGWSAVQALGKVGHELLMTRFPRPLGEIESELFEQGRWEGELIHTSKNGSEIVVHSRWGLQHNAQHELTAILETNHDITGRKLTEEARCRNERLLELFVEHAPAAIAMFDRDMKYIVASRRFRTDYGLGRQSLVGRSHYEVFPEIPRHWKAVHQRCLDGAVERCEQDPFIHADGRIDWMRWEMRPWHESAGEIGGMILFSEVTTDRKLAEERLRDQTAELEHLYSTNPVGLGLVDSDLRFVRINERLAEINGRPVAHHMGRSLGEAVPLLADHIEPICRSVLETGQSKLRVEVRGTTPADPLTERDWLASYHRVKGTKGTFYVGIVVEDITERKQAAKELVASERRFRDIFTFAPVGIYQSSLDGTFLTANQTLADMLGYASVDELLGLKPVSGIYFTEDECEKLIPGYEGRGHAVDLDLQWKRKDGSPISIQLSAHAVKRPDGEIEYLEGFVHDVTERKRAEAAARRGLKELSVLYQSSLVFGESRDPETVGKHIIETLEQLLPYEHCSIWMRRDDTMELEVLAHSNPGLKPDAMEEELVRVRSLASRLRDGICGWVSVHGEPVRTGDVKQDRRYVEAHAATQSKLCVPLKVDGRTVGVINVESSLPDAFTEHDERLLTTLANQAVVATENARLFHELELDVSKRKQAEKSLRRFPRLLLRAEDHERRRIAKELHDSTAQDLVAVMMNLSTIQEAIADGDTKAGAILADSLALVENCANDIRTLSYVLHPPLLDDMGLVGGLTEYAAGLGKRAQIRIRVEAPPDFQRLPEETEVVLFRVAQESLSNVVRHSASDTATIRLSRNKSGVVLEIEDYGRGLPPGDATQAGTSGVGIAGMRERMQQLGGHLQIESSGRGTTVRAVLPLREEGK